MIVMVQMPVARCIGVAVSISSPTVSYSTCCDSGFDSRRCYQIIVNMLTNEYLGRHEVRRRGSRPSILRLIGHVCENSQARPQSEFPRRGTALKGLADCLPRLE